MRVDKIKIIIDVACTAPNNSFVQTRKENNVRNEDRLMVCILRGDLKESTLGVWRMPFGRLFHNVRDHRW